VFQGRGGCTASVPDLPREVPIRLASTEARTHPMRSRPRLISEGWFRPSHLIGSHDVGPPSPESQLKTWFLVPQAVTVYTRVSKEDLEEPASNTASGTRTSRVRTRRADLRSTAQTDELCPDAEAEAAPHGLTRLTETDK